MKSGKVLLGVLAGVAAGALIGVLFAPEKGTVTRKKIVAKGDDYADHLKDKFNQFMEEVKKDVAIVKDKTNEFMDNEANKVITSESN